MSDDYEKRSDMASETDIRTTSPDIIVQKSWLKQLISEVKSDFVGDIKSLLMSQSQSSKEEERQRRHTNIFCDECDEAIVGVRYKCSNCVDYDLCASCEAEAENLHEHGHVFLKLIKPLPRAAGKALGAAPLLSYNLYSEDPREQYCHDCTQQRIKHARSKLQDRHDRYKEKVRWTREHSAPLSDEEARRMAKAAVSDGVGGNYASAMAERLGDGTLDGDQSGNEDDVVSVSSHSCLSSHGAEHSLSGCSHTPPDNSHVLVSGREHASVPGGSQTLASSCDHFKEDEDRCLCASSTDYSDSASEFSDDSEFDEDSDDREPLDRNMDKYGCHVLNTAWPATTTQAWLVRNTGCVTWDERVKLVLLSGTLPILPNDHVHRVPPLRPGEVGEIYLQLFWDADTAGVISGKHGCTWGLSFEGIVFQTALHCSFHVFESGNGRTVISPLSGVQPVQVYLAIGKPVGEELTFKEPIVPDLSNELSDYTGPIIPDFINEVPTNENPAFQELTNGVPALSELNSGEPQLTNSDLTSEHNVLQDDHSGCITAYPTVGADVLRSSTLQLSTLQTSAAQSAESDAAESDTYVVVGEDESDEDLRGNCSSDISSRDFEVINSVGSTSCSDDEDDDFLMVQIPDCFAGIDLSTSVWRSAGGTSVGAVKSSGSSSDVEVLDAGPGCSVGVNVLPPSPGGSADEECWDGETDLHSTSLLPAASQTVGDLAVDDEEVPPISTTEKMPPPSTTEEAPPLSITKEVPSLPKAAELPLLSVAVEVPPRPTTEELPPPSTTEELPPPSTTEEVPPLPSEESPSIPDTLEDVFSNIIEVGSGVARNVLQYFTAQEEYQVPQSNWTPSEPAPTFPATPYVPEPAQNGSWATPSPVHPSLKTLSEYVPEPAQDSWAPRPHTWTGPAEYVPRPQDSWLPSFGAAEYVPRQSEWTPHFAGHGADQKLDQRWYQQ